MTTETPYQLPKESRREIFHGLLRKIMVPDEGSTTVTFKIQNFSDEDWVVINALADDGFTFKAALLCLAKIGEEIEAKV